MVFVIAVAAAACRPAPPVPTAANEAAIADTVRRLAHDFIAADHQQKPDEVVALFEDGPQAAIASNGVLRPSRAAFRDALVSLYAVTQSLDITPDSARVSVLGPGAAALTETYHYRRSGKDGKSSSGVAVITYVCRRGESGWKILHYHFSQKADS